MAGGGGQAGGTGGNAANDSTLGGPATDLGDFANTGWPGESDYAILSFDQLEYGRVNFGEDVADGGLGGIAAGFALDASLQQQDQADDAAQHDGFGSSTYDENYASAFGEDAFLSTAGLLGQSGLGGVMPEGAGLGPAGVSDAQGQGQSTYLGSFDGDLTGSLFGFDSGGLGRGGLDVAMGMNLGSLDFLPDVYNMPDGEMEFDFAPPSAREESAGMTAVHTQEAAVSATVAEEIAAAPIIAAGDQAETAQGCPAPDTAPSSLQQPLAATSIVQAAAVPAAALFGRDKPAEPPDPALAPARYGHEADGNETSTDEELGRRIARRGKQVTAPPDKSENGKRSREVSAPVKEAETLESTAMELDDRAVKEGTETQLLPPTPAKSGQPETIAGPPEASALDAEAERQGLPLPPELGMEGEEAGEEDDAEELEELQSLADSFSDHMSAHNPSRSEKAGGLVLTEEEMLELAQDAEDEAPEPDWPRKPVRQASVCFPTRPIVRSESTVRILELNKIENSIISLLETASRAVQVLASPPRNTIDTPDDRESESRERLEDFDRHIEEYFRLLDEIQDNLRRHIRFLSSTGVSFHAPSGRFAPSSSVSAASSGSVVQQLLPFRGSAHGDAKDLEIWTRAAAVLRRGLKALAVEASTEIPAPLSQMAPPKPPPQPRSSPPTQPHPPPSPSEPPPARNHVDRPCIPSP